jgi:hypothetical protein
MEKDPIIINEWLAYFTSVHYLLVSYNAGVPSIKWEQMYDSDGRKGKLKHKFQRDKYKPHEKAHFQFLSLSVDLYYRSIKQQLKKMKRIM